MPDTSKDSLSWSDIAELLAPQRSYWLCSVNADGSPHTVPVWGVVVDEEFYLFSELDTLKVRNVHSDPRVIIHLESTDNVVIVHGELHNVGKPAHNLAMIQSLATKYDRPSDAAYIPPRDSDSALIYALHPQRALLWNLAEFDETQRRWSAS